MASCLDATSVYQHASDLFPFLCVCFTYVLIPRTANAPFPYTIQASYSNPNTLPGSPYTPIPISRQQNRPMNMSHLDSLAGLDSMVLHINTPSPTVTTAPITLDGEPYILVPRKKRKLARAGRKPLADKTSATNVLTVCFSCTF